MFKIIEDRPMNITFQNGVDYRVGSLMLEMTKLIEEIPRKACADEQVLRKALEELQIEITGSTTWKCETAFETIIISRRFFEALWIFCYAHLRIYAKVLAGNLIEGSVDLEHDPDLDLPRAMLTWLHSENARDGAPVPDHFPDPDPDAERKSIEGTAYRITVHAIRFHVFHELNHVVLAKTGTKPAEKIDEERACDFQAIHWMDTRGAADYAEFEGTKTGSAMGLLYLAAFGLDTGLHDGIGHPKTYHRVIDTLGKVYTAKDDRVWAPVVAVLAAHCTKNDVNLKWPNEGFDDFREAARFVREEIDKRYAN